MRWTSLHAGALLLLGICYIAPAGAAPGLDNLTVNLDPLIDAAVHSRNRFAVDIPHAISSSTQGRWSRQGSTSTWSYSVRIPTAISMSFRATLLALPPSAILTVTAGNTSAKYRARDVNRGGLWGRPLVGDTLNFSLSVDTVEAGQARVQIESLQAGYRSLGAGATDHPHYKHIMSAAAAATTTATCTENYSCDATTTNHGPAQATVAVLIGNQYQCTGTLLNDTSGDGTPYVLTARHCENGELGGGKPGAAASVTIYWDAVSACGTPLGSIYDGNVVSQSGAATIVEQQDAWLIKLDAPPAANDAYYAGWDATGGVFTGGYSIHHALGNDKQYVAWYGQSLLQPIQAATLKIAYNSTFWAVANQLGSVGSGSSGSALFDPDNRVVGSASLASLTNGAGSAGVCPATPLVAPSASTLSAQYTALSGVWTSTADSTTSTGATTLQSVLDPGNTGQMAIGGFGTTPITLTADKTAATAGDTVTLSWNVAGAQSCTASGGIGGDGWTGSQPASGSAHVTAQTGGQIDYSLRCSIGDLVGRGSVGVTWNYDPPFLMLNATSAPVTIGGTASITWVTAETPCTATGGSPGDGWAGTKATAGSQSVVTTLMGATQYTLTCGVGGRTISQQALILVVPPSITLLADATQLRVGSNVTFNWFGEGTGGSCAPSGGSPTDNWTQNNATAISNGSELTTETTAGTYTYTLTCSGGGQSASSSVTVVFTDDPPMVTLTPIAHQQQVYTQGAAASTDLQNLLWTSNLGGCSIDSTAPDGSAGHVIPTQGQAPAGSAADVEYVPGHYLYTIYCGALQATTAIDWVTTPTPAALTASANTWTANLPYTLAWTTSAGPCTASGGSSGDGWVGAKAASGTQSMSESKPGSYTFRLTCGAGTATTQSQVAVVVPAPYIQIYASPSGGDAGEATTSITWASSVGPCTYLDGSSGSTSRGVAVAPNASATPRPQVSGTYIYSITCGAGAQTLYAATVASVNLAAPTTQPTGTSSVAVNTPAPSAPAPTPAPPPAPTPAVIPSASPSNSAASSNGGGGGGAFDPLWLALLSLLLGVRMLYSSRSPPVPGTRCSDKPAQPSIGHAANGYGVVSVTNVRNSMTWRA